MKDFYNKITAKFESESVLDEFIKEGICKCKLFIPINDKREA